MAGKLTETRVKNAEAPTDGRSQIILSDGEVRGFGLRITKGGHKSYVLSYRNSTGRKHRHTIGDQSSWPLAAARDEAQRLKRDIDLGGDPVERRTTVREGKTVDELADMYLAEHVAVSNKPASYKDVKSILDQWIRPELGKLKVVEVTHDDIVALHKKITAGVKGRGRGRPTPTRANRVIARASKMFSLAVPKMRPDNPVKGVKKNSENERHRYLTMAELKRMNRAIEAEPDPIVADAVRFLILTGARSGEVMHATVGQFDLEANAWTKPRATTKQKKMHRVPLNAAAADIAAAYAEGKRRGDLLFPGLKRHVLRRAWKAVKKAADIEDVRIHDLRHSYASFLASAGMSLPIIGALLGHTSPATTQRYAHLLDDPLRKATERVGKLITVRKPSV